MKIVNKKITPENVTKLSSCEIFVFGSNLAGEHLGGAAKFAYEEFGAEWGVGSGPTGRCYAIPTMQGDLESIRPYAEEFIRYAKEHPDNRFLLTRVGCGIAGFKDKEMAGLFEECKDIPNVSIPEAWNKIFNFWGFIDAEATGQTGLYRDDAPNVINEEVLKALCKKYRYEIGAHITSKLPNIRIRYVTYSDTFGYANFGDFFMIETGDLYVWHTKDSWAEYHNQDMVACFFDDECEGRGYAVRSMFAGVRTEYSDMEGHSLYTGDVMNVTEKDGSHFGTLALASSGNGENGFYGFPLDNHSLTLRMCHENEMQLKKAGTVFFGLDMNEWPVPVWNLALEFNGPFGRYESPDEKRCKKLMAKFTPDFGNNQMADHKRNYKRILSGLAGESAVMRELCVRGWLPSMSYNNSPIFDLFCYNPELDRTVTIQVKTVKEKEDGKKIPSFPISGNRDERLSFYKEVSGPYVFVYIDKDNNFKFYILSKDQFIDLSSQIEYDYDNFPRSKPLKPGSPMAMPLKNLQEFENCWENLWMNEK